MYSKGLLNFIGGLVDSHFIILLLLLYIITIIIVILLYEIEWIEIWISWKLCIIAL